MRARLLSFKPNGSALEARVVFESEESPEYDEKGVELPRKFSETVNIALPDTTTEEELLAAVAKEKKRFDDRQPRMDKIQKLVGKELKLPEVVDPKVK